MPRLLLCVLLTAPLFARDPLCERVPLPPVETVGKMAYQDAEFRLTNYTEVVVDGVNVGDYRKVPAGAKLVEVVLDRRHVTRIVFTTKAD